MPFDFSAYWPHLTAATLLDIALIVIFIPWVLLSKKDASATVAWCLVVLLMPWFGALLFWVFGYNYLLHRVRHQRGDKRPERRLPPPPPPLSADENCQEHQLGELAQRVQAYPVRAGNAVTVYHETEQAFTSLLEAIGAARHYIHLEYFILRSDDTGCRLLDLLERKAKEGIEVRLLFDGMGSMKLKRSRLRPLVEAGGQAAAFLPDPSCSRGRASRTRRWHARSGHSFSVQSCCTTAVLCNRSAASSHQTTSDGVIANACGASDCAIGFAPPRAER